MDMSGQPYKYMFVLDFTPAEKSCGKEVFILFFSCQTLKKKLNIPDFSVVRKVMREQWRN